MMLFENSAKLFGMNQATYHIKLTNFSFCLKLCDNSFNIKIKINALPIVT